MAPHSFPMVVFPLGILAFVAWTALGPRQQKSRVAVTLVCVASAILAILYPFTSTKAAMCLMCVAVLAVPIAMIFQTVRELKASGAWPAPTRHDSTPLPEETTP